MVTQGINHTGLSVRNLDDTVRFFCDILGWVETGRDDTYPRSAVSDGTSRLTLWQVSDDRDPVDFDRHHNIGLHHMAIEVPDEATLTALTAKVAAHPGVKIEFMPEPMGDGPRQHMMFSEPGGIRLELVWPST
ncbi:VOC family protein [Alisedimentitalea sp. MJ-SS2]|uniref:VOC family protein n=1 Tax=Aliisedimentitalea sp. MJ-SS2 TaxID=3049795 RepID=UPI0029073271|nr:VOC family protein [Alisedimentitalea sp. MJ-SS2]MDU8929411.1 VOC family protein [Alisedimentitalea sp. MJ-SS2]